MYTKTLTNVVLVAVVALSLVASAGVVAAGDVTTPAGTPADVETGTETQTISNLTVTNTSAGEDGVDVYLNVTALETADVGLDGLEVQANGSNDTNDTDAATVTNATLSETNVSTGANNTVVTLTFDVAENETSFTVDELRLSGLDTENASATENLTYDVASGDEERVGSDAPGADDAQTESFALVESSDGDETTATETDSDDATETDTDDGTETDADGTETDSDDGTDTATDDGAEGDADDGTETDAGDGDGTDEDGGSFADAPGFGAFAAIAGLLGAALYVRRT